MSACLTCLGSLFLVICNIFHEAGLRCTFGYKLSNAKVSVVQEICPMKPSSIFDLLRDSASQGSLHSAHKLLSYNAFFRYVCLVSGLREPVHCYMNTYVHINEHHKNKKINSGLWYTKARCIEIVLQPY